MPLLRKPKAIMTYIPLLIAAPENRLGPTYTISSLRAMFYLFNPFRLHAGILPEEVLATIISLVISFHFEIELRHPAHVLERILLKAMEIAVLVRAYEAVRLVCFSQIRPETPIYVDMSSTVQ